MRYLGMDFGQARIGVAVSDEGGAIAFPREVVSNTGIKHVAARLKKIAAEERISEIIIGLPLDRENRETEESLVVRKFAENLRGMLAIPVVFENERFTTKMAEHGGVDRSKADAAAAAIILQSYLDKKKLN